MLRLVADDNHRQVVLVVKVAEPSATGHRQVEDVLSLRHIPLEDGVLNFFVLIFDRIGANSKFGAKEAQTCRHSFDVWQIAHRQRIVIGKLLARSHFIGHAAKGEEVQVEHENDIRSDTGDQVANVVIESPSNRGDADHHRHADHDAEYG